jgi:hypothetical protein
MRHDRPFMLTGAIVLLAAMLALSAGLVSGAILQAAGRNGDEFRNIGALLGLLLGVPGVGSIVYGIMKGRGEGRAGQN